MSGVAIIRHLLANNAPFIAQVPAARIFAGAIPANTAVPCVGVALVSGTEFQTVAMEESGRLRAERVQVTVHAGTYPAKRTILNLARTACANQHATVNGFACDSILPEGEGPDFDDPGIALYEGSRDFMVRYGT